MILETLAKLSAAEQFFETLQVPFDPQVVNVHRLHILKRFRELVQSVKLEGLSEAATEGTCREALIQAYHEFAEGRGKKTFKVFTQAHPAFVPLSDITSGR
jgi:nitrogenase-stabilizing/protective protein